MRIDLRLQIAKLHGELLTFQLVGNDLLLVLLSLIIENHHKGIGGNKPNQSHQESHKKAREVKDFGKRFPFDKMKQASIDCDGDNRP